MASASHKNRASGRLQRSDRLVFEGRSGSGLWRKDSKVRQRWAKIRPGMTVDKALEAGATTGDIRHAVKFKQVQLER